MWTNREVTGLTEVPRRLLVLGGGPVGVEMAQAVHRLGASVALVEGADRVLPREPEPLGKALGEALAADGIELCFGQHAAAVRREDGEYVLEFPDARRAARRQAAGGHRPPPARGRTSGSTRSAIEPTRSGIEVDARMNVADGVWAIGDVTGIWPLTYVGKYQGRVAAANILGEPREANYDGGAARRLHRPAGRLGRRGRGRSSPRPSSWRRCRAPRPTPAPTRSEPGFMTLVSDGERLTGAYALGPEAGEWLQQATLAIRARVPLDGDGRRDPAVPDLLGGLPQHGARAARYCTRRSRSA